jgi:hypothetical protein
MRASASLAALSCIRHKSCRILLNQFIIMSYVSQTIERLESMVDGGNFYEAQQMYKSTSARYYVLISITIAQFQQPYVSVYLKVSYYMVEIVGICKILTLIQD